MDERHTEKPGRVALVSPTAASDLSANHTYTAQQWDFEQAERYTEFLKTSMQQLAEEPYRGNPISNRPGMFEYIVKWKNAKHGHRIVYEEIHDGIYVRRILHTSMNWQQHITGDE
jgi:plasmid stabilization system protein ParE